MPNVSDMKSSNSRFLTQKDVGPGILATVAKVFLDNVAAEGAPPDEKWVMAINEHEKPLVLNNTNLDLMEFATNSPDTDDWIGKHVVIYTDHAVMYAGRRTGGLRVRAPKPGSVPEPVPPNAELQGGGGSTNDHDDFDDDIPFIRW